MKNKFNRCCCEEQELPVDCIICQTPLVGNDGCATSLVEGTNNLFLAPAEYPDWGPGFVSRGHLAGDVYIPGPEREFRVLFDYVDRGNYFAVGFKIDDSVTAAVDSQLEVTIYRRSASSTTVLASRKVVLGVDIPLNDGWWCVHWDADEIHVDITYGRVWGGTLETAKTGNNESGIVGVHKLGAFADGHIYLYARYNDETDSGICEGCPPISPIEPTFCCPEGIAANWLVDFNLFVLTNNYFSSCSELNGNTYILDRLIESPTVAEYEEIFRLAYSDTGCFGPFDVRVTIAIDITQIEDNCSLQLAITTTPYSAGQVCLNAGTLLVYQKTGMTIGEACSGSHVLALAFSDLGASNQCNGTVPATITVESL